MVKIIVKKGDEQRFLLEQPADTVVDDLTKLCAELHNALLKIDRIACEFDELAKHGVTMPPNMQGLTDDQVIELKLKDEYLEKCTPVNGFIENKDDMRRRNGRAPTEQMAQILKKAANEAKSMVSKKLIEQDICLTTTMVKEAMNILNGAVMIVFPMGLPPYDPIKMELDNEEDLEGTQACKEVIIPESASLWFCGKELLIGRKLCDYSGRNEKTKIVVKLTKIGQGPPAREPVVSEKDQRAMMAYYHKKQEDWKKLEEKSKDDDSYLDSDWANSGRLKREFHGLQNIKWGPR